MAEPKRTSRDRSRSGLGLLAVQSIIGAVVLLLALVVRLIGGDVYAQLQEAFRTAVTQDVLTQQLTQDDTEGQGGEDIKVGAASVLMPPDGATFTPLTLPEEPHAVLDKGRVTSTFGYRENPLGGGTGFHTGVDIAASSGTPLYAAYDGTITKAGWDNSYGNYLVLTCFDGLEVWYAHCSALRCRSGDTVQAGDVVATVGSTGNSTGPHVHLMTVREGVAYNPALLVPEGCYA
ncbi:MAG: M23 family metallopeptidase [Clostridia bacterium]|nr:M23 family metallopeptidase [Clostridia bacterium]